MENRTDTFHKLVAEKLKDKANENFTNILRREEVHRLMFQSCRIPISLHNDFLGEMEDLGLIKIKDKQNIEIL